MEWKQTLKHNNYPLPAHEQKAKVYGLILETGGRLSNDWFQLRKDLRAKIPDRSAKKQFSRLFRRLLADISYCLQKEIARRMSSYLRKQRIRLAHQHTRDASLRHLSQTADLPIRIDA